MVTRTQGATTPIQIGRSWVQYTGARGHETLFRFRVGREEKRAQFVSRDIVDQDGRVGGVSYELSLRVVFVDDATLSYA